MSTCPACGWRDGDHAWLCPTRDAKAYSDGNTIWGPVCNCGDFRQKPHRHGVSAGGNS